MADSPIANLSRQLISKEGRLRALQTIDSIGPLTEEIIQSLTDNLVLALETERNAYTVLQILKQLRRFAESHPGSATSAAEPVVELISQTLVDFEGDDPAENQRVRQGTTILKALIEGTDPEEMVLDITYGDVASLIAQGNPEHRVVGYRLLGRTATGEAVRVLSQSFTHEFEEVRRASKLGLRDARELARQSLSGRGPVRRIDAIDAFVQLYADGRVEPTATQLEEIEHGVLTAARTDDAERREQIASVVETLVKTDTDAAESLITELFTIIQTAPEPRPTLWNLLQAAAKGTPEKVLEHAATIADELEVDNPATVVAALDVIRTAAERTASVPVSLADPVLRTVDDADTEIARAAIRTVATMGFYPVPERIDELARQGESSLSKAAYGARERLQAGADEVPRFAHALSEVKTTVSLFAGDPGEIHLKRRAADGAWVDLDPGDVSKGIIEATLEDIERGENVPVVYPYYEPAEVVPLAIAVVLTAPEEDRQIGLYSPGSQSHWGTKGQLRDCLREFALSDVSGPVIKATPIPEVITESYVGKDGLTDNSAGDGPGRIVLSKKMPELVEVPKLDVTILNMTSKTSLEFQEDIDELEREHPDTIFVSTYSYLVQNETEARPRYGPPAGLGGIRTVPGADIIDPTLEDDPGSTASEMTERKGGSVTTIEDEAAHHKQVGTDDVRALSRPARIRIEHVEGDDLSRLLDQVFEQSASLFEVDDAGAGGLIFSRQLFFERLPIPPDTFDDWIRARYEEGDRFLPPLIQERIDDVERKGAVVENLEAVQPLDTAEKLLKRAHEELRRRNPLFDRLQEAITGAKAVGERLAIFQPGSTYARMLEDVLVSHDIITVDDLEAGHIRVVSPNDARVMGPCDTLLVFGTLHPENAAFYVHPRVDETVVMTYDRLWVDSIRRHATGYIELLNETVGEPGYEPYPEPELIGDIEPAEVEVLDKLQHDQMRTEQAQEAESSTTPIKADIITRAMASASMAEYGDEADRYERSLRYYLIETEDGERFELTNQETILRKRTVTDRNRFHWTSPEVLSEGDTIVSIPAEIEEQLWREHLEVSYGDGMAAEAAIENLQKWCDAIDDIWQAVCRQVAGDQGVFDMEIHRRIHGWLSSEVDEFDRAPSTVRTWFESVREADGPMHLVQNPSLIIGPRSHRDIEAIGRAFGYELLENEAETIGKAMEGLRTINRREGHRHRESLREQVAGGEPTPASEAATYHVVKTITEADERFDFEQNDDSSTDTVSESNLTEEELLDRLSELIELAPTKNSELMHAWGFDSGSDVHRFLESELAGYHERNEDKLIVPTEAARELVRDRR